MKQERNWESEKDFEEGLEEPEDDENEAPRDKPELE